MRKYLLILLLSGVFANAQSKVTFSYDAAGNQISRILCINCAGKTVEEVKEIEAIVESDLEKFSEEDLFSYYPNPVKEELYLQWQLSQENYVTSVSVYSMAGQVLRKYSGSSRTNSLNLPFQEYPSGVYIVLVTYKNGDDKSIKIIKQ